jgi:hypothetical protein
MFSTFTRGSGGGEAEAVGGGSAATLAAGIGVVLAEGVALAAGAALGAGAAFVPADAATTGSGCGIGVDGARSHAALGRTMAARAARLRRQARVLIGDFLLQENVG